MQLRNIRRKLKQKRHNFEITEILKRRNFKAHAERPFSEFRFCSFTTPGTFTTFWNFMTEGTENLARILWYLIACFVARVVSQLLCRRKHSSSSAIILVSALN